MPEKIKKHNNRNCYALGPNNVWVRDFCSEGVRREIDINNLIPKKELPLVMENELANKISKYQDIATETIRIENIIIVSNGFNFIEKQEILSDLKNVSVIGTNKCIDYWNIRDKKPIHYYVVNNPYQECLSYLPNKTRYYPSCIASIRTNPNFLKKYNGMKYIYYPSENQYYSGFHGDSYKIDDYRNPICAALGLSFRFGARKILLFCCDDVFKDERQTAVKMPNGLWSYPQQIMSDGIIDMNLYWMQMAGIKIANHSSGTDMKYAGYIREEDIKSFFEDE